MHLVYVIAPGGGPEANVKALAPELQTCGHQISVIYTAAPRVVGGAWSSSIRFAFAPPTPLHYYLAKLVGAFHAAPRRLRAWEQALAIRKTLGEIEKTQRVDLVEVTEGLPLQPLRKITRIMVRAHGADWTVRHFCRDGDIGKDRWLIALQAKQFNLACATSALSEHLARHLSEMLQFPFERIKVIPYGIDTAAFAPDRNEAKSPSAPILLSVGRLEHRKGTDILLRAMQRVWRAFPDAQVHLVGSEGEYSKAGLLEMVREEKRANVIFHGIVARDRLPAHYQRATIYVAPTQYETFGYTILEAMACGVPVVASRVGAVPELVGDGVTGLLVPPRDPETLAEAIIALLGDRARRGRMGQCAREKAVARFALEQNAAALLEFYECALSRSTIR